LSIEILRRKNIFLEYLKNVSIQGINAVLPLIFIPIVTKYIGLENLGIVNFSQSYILYFTLLINFGFDFSGARLLAQENHIQSYSLIINRIFSAKLYLFILSSIIFLFSILIFDTFRHDFLLHITTYIINIGFLIYPHWFFIGTGRYGYILKVTLIIRVAFMILTIGMLEFWNNYLFFPFFMSLIQVVIGIFGLYYMLKNTNMQMRLLPISKSIEVIKSSFSLFLSTAFINFYTTTTIFLLGFLTVDYLTVGSFSIGYKFMLGVNSIVITAFSQTIFAKIAIQMNKSPFAGIQTINKLLLPTILFTVLITLSIFIFADFIANIFSNEQTQEIAIIIKILSITPVFIITSNLLALQVLINLQKDSSVLYNTIIASTFSITTNIVLIPIYGGYSSAVIVVFTELLIVVLSYRSIQKLGYKISFLNTTLLKEIIQYAKS